MTKVFLIVALMATAAMTVERWSVMAEPEGDCSTVLFDINDCIPFITVGSEKKNPTKECCSAFKRVLKSDAECVCEALQLSSEMALNFDPTRVMSLPSACRVSSSYPPIPNCDNKSPAVTPSQAPSVIGGGGSPASSPSGARVIAASPILLVVGVFSLLFLH